MFPRRRCYPSIDVFAGNGQKGTKKKEKFLKGWSGGSGRLGVLTLDGEQVCIGLDGDDDGGNELNPGSAGYFAAFAMAPSHTVNLATDGYGRLLGQIYGNSVDDVAMRNAIQDFPDVDVPNPYPAESEGGES